MDGWPAPSAHANGSATAAQASAVASRAPESNGNGAHGAQRQRSDDPTDLGAAAPLSAAQGEAVGGPKQPAGMTTSGAGEPADSDSQNGMVPALATTAGNKKHAAAAAVVSPFTAARLTKQADPHPANSYTVVAAAHTTLDSATSGLLPP